MLKRCMKTIFTIKLYYSIQGYYRLYLVEWFVISGYHCIYSCSRADSETTAYFPVTDQSSIYFCYTLFSSCTLAFLAYFSIAS